MHFRQLSTLFSCQADSVRRAQRLQACLSLFLPLPHQPADLPELGNGGVAHALIKPRLAGRDDHALSPQPLQRQFRFLLVAGRDAVGQHVHSVVRVLRQQIKARLRDTNVRLDTADDGRELREVSASARSRAEFKQNRKRLPCGPGSAGRRARRILAPTCRTPTCLRRIRDGSSRVVERARCCRVWRAVGRLRRRGC